MLSALCITAPAGRVTARPAAGERSRRHRIPLYHHHHLLLLLLLASLCGCATAAPTAQGSQEQRARPSAAHGHGHARQASAQRQQRGGRALDGLEAALPDACVLIDGTSYPDATIS